MITKQCYPGGKKYILTMSYDDGVIADRRLVEIFNRYGIKGTFHVNSALTDRPGRIPLSEYASLYAGHEISCHSRTHPHLEILSDYDLTEEILGDRKTLEAVAGYPVYGMSYPYGAYDSRVLDALRRCGIVYSRTTQATRNFTIPENFLTWHPTCHHGDCLELAESFFNLMERKFVRPLFYVWGHSYEFDNANNWDLIERFCDKMAGKEQIWYATNLEIYRYIQAQNALVFTAEQTMVYNPSAISVWLNVDGEGVEIAPGASQALK